MKNLFLTLIAFMAFQRSIQAQSIHVVKSFYHSDSLYHGEKEYVEYNNKLYFLSGNSLWLTDGTDTGTKKIARFDRAIGLTTVSDGLFFMADDFTHGWELWKTDGTIQGTRLVADINPGMSQGCYMPDEPLPMAKVADTVFFYADNGADGIELWRSDGTTTGTFMVKNINDIPGKGLHYKDVIPNIAVTTGNKILFQASDTITGTEIWVSDGTSTGTKLLKDIYMSKNPALLSHSNILLNFGNSIFFSTLGLGLYITDGTESNTVLLFSPGTTPSSLDKVIYNNKMYFYSGGLIESDGTSAGTKKICNIRGTVAYEGKSILLTIYKNKLIFAGYDADSVNTNDGIWESDGTAAGTKMIFKTGFTVRHLKVFNGKVYFKYVNKDKDVVEVMQYDGSTVTSAPSAYSLIKINGNPFYPHQFREGVFVEYKNVLFFDHCFDIHATSIQLCRLGMWPDDVAQIENNADVYVYPNPTQNSLTVKGKNLEYITITNIAGIAIYSSAINGMQQVDTRNWVPGIYMVTIETNNGEVVYRKIAKE